jgi:hypothetical protein
MKFDEVTRVRFFYNDRILKRWVAPGLVYDLAAPKKFHRPRMRLEVEKSVADVVEAPRQD